MEDENRIDLLKEMRFFKGLGENELSQIANLCHEHSYSAGEICQAEGRSLNRVHILVKGKLGVILNMPSFAYSNNEIVLETLHGGDLFGWSNLIKGTPWSTLKVLEAADTLYIDADAMIDLCDKNNHIGYILMKNLAGVISARLRKNRMSILNAFIAMKGEG